MRDINSLRKLQSVCANASRLPSAALDGAFALAFWAAAKRHYQCGADTFINCVLLNLLSYIEGKAGTAALTSAKAACKA